MENNFKIINIEKAMHIFSTTEYMQFGTESRIMPINIYRSENSFDIIYSWMRNENLSHNSTLLKLITECVYDVDNCEFTSTNTLKSKVKFFEQIPIELSTLFSSEKDMANIFNFSENKKIILEFDSNSKMTGFKNLAKLTLDEGSKIVNGKDRTYFKDILNYGRAAPLALLSLYGLQSHIHNNVIYMITKGYFRFWKLIPVDFIEATEYWKQK
jgi:hypothetical protein